jgi:hypothetical protein
VTLGDPRLYPAFWRKVKLCPDRGCWLWTGHTKYGYAVTKSIRNGRQYMTGGHRLAYIALVGEVPAGLQLDHLCRVRNCVNPAHLEPVTLRENQMRGVGFVAVNAAKTHCSRGHAFDERNTYFWRGHRHCIACRGVRKAEKAAKTP